MSFDFNCNVMNSSVCSACKTGYYLDDGKCYIDSAHKYCASLTPQNGCTVCLAGYQYGMVLQKLGFCSQPDDNCLTFTVDLQNCTSCRNGLQLAEGWCYQKDAHCQSYNRSICTACINNYYLFEGWCRQDSTSCLQSTSNGCVLCILGYYAFGGTCRQPDPNCQILTPYGCNLCALGY